MFCLLFLFVCFECVWVVEFYFLKCVGLFCCFWGFFILVAAAENGGCFTTTKGNLKIKHIYLQGKQL